MIVYEDLDKLAALCVFHLILFKRMIYYKSLCLIGFVYEQVILIELSMFL